MRKKTFITLVVILIFPAILFLSKTNFEKIDIHETFIHKTFSFLQPEGSLVFNKPISLYHWKNNQNVDVYFVPTKELPITDLYVTFDAGSSRDDTLPGLANLCSSLLEEGTSSYTADQIAEKFESVGAEFTTKVTRDRMVIKIRSLSDPNILQPVITLVSDLISNPNFNDAAFSQVKNQILIDLKKSADYPSTVALRAFYQGIYPDHPYGELVAGTYKSVSKIQQSDLKQFHQKYFVTKNAFVTIVGDLDESMARFLSNEVLKKLKPGSLPPLLPSIQPLGTSITTHLPFNSTQTHIIMGQPIQKIAIEDYPALKLGNYVLGGGTFISRLFKEIRDKHGFSYSIDSLINKLSQGGNFMILMQTKNSQSKAAIDASQKILLEFLKKGPTSAELKDAKQGLIGEFALNISNNEKIADFISEIVFYKLPLNSLTSYPEAIKQLTPEIVHETFKKYIDPDKMVLITVGDELH